MYRLPCQFRDIWKQEMLKFLQRQICNAGRIRVFIYFINVLFLFAVLAQALSGKFGEHRDHFVLLLANIAVPCFLSLNIKCKEYSNGEITYTGWTFLFYFLYLCFFSIIIFALTLDHKLEKDISFLIALEYQYVIWIVSLFYGYILYSTLTRALPSTSNPARIDLARPPESR